MDQQLGIFLTPLFLLPGVALLIMSTSARFARLHAEIHAVVAQQSPRAKTRTRLLVRRARFFRTTLVSFYLAVALLASASLIGGVVHFLEGDAAETLLVLICLAIIAVVFGSFQLVRESFLSLEIILEMCHDVSEPTDD